jgi:thiamine-monophosphate kinase
MSGFSEESLHRIFQSSFVGRKGILGPGSDCAQLTPPKGRRLLQTVDQVIAGVHLDADATPTAYARKLLRRTLSDLAAVGATPWTVSWTLALPTDWTALQIRTLAKAFLKEAAAFHVPVIGGDCSQSSQVVLTCTAMGLDNGPVPGRAGAKPGDVILVTGKLGASVTTGAHLLPEPRLREGKHLVQNYKPHAMMDLSDGLAKDLPRILRASAVGAEIEVTALPLDKTLSQSQVGWESAVGEGEDYELLVVLNPRQAKRALEDRVLRKVGMHAIGMITEGAKLRWLENGRGKQLKSKGWEHHWA